jgi:NADH-quinone oxidoreductase subunit L
MVNGLARLFGAIAAGLRGTQTGMVHNYAMGMVVGVVLIVGFFVLK